MRTFGKEWLTISGSPIPTISMNGSQLGNVAIDGKEISHSTNDRLSAFGIDAVLAGVDALLADDIRDLLLF